MKCPECGNTEDKVIETREGRDARYIRRRRECLDCGRRFTTYEKIEDIPLMVVKKDGRREEFDIDKVRKGLYRAVEKRPIQAKQIEQIAHQIEEKISHSDKEVTTKEIGDAYKESLQGMVVKVTAQDGAQVSSGTNILGIVPEGTHFKVIQERKTHSGSWLLGQFEIQGKGTHGWVQKKLVRPIEEKG